MCCYTAVQQVRVTLTLTQTLTITVAYRWCLYHVVDRSICVPRSLRVSVRYY